MKGTDYKITFTALDGGSHSEIFYAVSEASALEQFYSKHSSALVESIEVVK